MAARKLAENPHYHKTDGNESLSLLQDAMLEGAMLGSAGEFDDGSDEDDGRLPSERLAAILNISNPSVVVRSQAMLHKITLCASEMPLNSPSWSLFLWALFYLCSLAPIVWYKIFTKFVGVAEWCLFLALISLQVIAALLSLFYLKYVSRRDISRIVFRIPKEAAADRPSSFIRVNRTDANIVWWLMVNTVLALVDLFHTKDYVETLCYLVWNFSSTLPVSVAVSMVAGMLTAYRLEVKEFYDHRTRLPFAIEDMKPVGREYVRLHKHLFLQSNVNSVYLCLFLLLAFIITIIEIARIYLQQTVIASVLCKGLFYWVALTEVFVYIARLNHYGRYVAHQFLVQVMQVYTANQLDLLSSISGSPSVLALQQSLLGQENVGRFSNSQNIANALAGPARASVGSRPALSRMGSMQASSEFVTQNLLISSMLISALPHLRLEFTIMGRFALSFESTVAVVASGVVVVAPKFLIPFFFPGTTV